MPNKQELLAGLNPKQKEAVLHTDASFDTSNCLFNRRKKRESMEHISDYLYQ